MRKVPKSRISWSDHGPQVPYCRGSWRIRRLVTPFSKSKDSCRSDQLKLSVSSLSLSGRGKGSPQWNGLWAAVSPLPKVELLSLVLTWTHVTHSPERALSHTSDYLIHRLPSAWTRYWTSQVGQMAFRYWPNRLLGLRTFIHQTWMKGDDTTLMIGKIQHIIKERSFFLKVSVIAKAAYL